MFRFTIRELILLTAVVALATGWWLEHRRLTDLSYLRELDLRHLEDRGKALQETVDAIEKEGYRWKTNLNGVRLERVPKDAGREEDEKSELENKREVQ